MARRERRAAWGSLAVLLVVGIGVSLAMARSSRSRAADDAAHAAKLVAQIELAPLLQQKDLAGPITGARYAQLTADIRREVTSPGPVERVTIWSSLGRVLYHMDPALVGTRSSALQQPVFEVANGEATHDVHDDTLRTFVPLWLAPGGTVVVAEMDRAFGPIASEANAPWHRLAIGLGAALLLALALYGLTFRAAAVPKHPQPVFEPQRPARLPRDLAPPAATDPIYMQQGFRSLEEARAAAEERASAAEASLHELQEQFKTAVQQMRALEARVASKEEIASHRDGDLRVLRDQVRESAERLEKAETRAAEAERELERAIAELDPLRSRFRMSKPSEALSDLDATGNANGPNGQGTLVVPDADGATADPPLRVIYAESTEEGVTPATGKAG